jgi:hypothetical protein
LTQLTRLFSINFNPFSLPYISFITAKQGVSYKSQTHERKENNRPKSDHKRNPRITKLINETTRIQIWPQKPGNKLVYKCVSIQIRRRELLNLQSFDEAFAALHGDLVEGHGRIDWPHLLHFHSSANHRRYEFHGQLQERNARAREH